MLTKSQVTESSFISVAEDKVDQAAHVIRKVKVIGLESVNRRRYKIEAIRKASPMYEDADVFVNHVRKPGEKRSDEYGERFGVLKNFVVESDGGYADLHYNPHHQRAEQIIYDVMKFPNKVGLSHHADISTTGTNPSVVESIDRVYSVDIVTRPATTKGVFEDQEPPAMKKTLKELITAAEAKSLSVLEDMMADGAMAAEMPVEAADGSDSDAQIKAAFESAIVAKFRDDGLDYKATLAAVKNILQAYDKLSGAPKEEAKSEPKTESVEEMHAKIVKLERRDEVRTLAAAEKVELSDVNLKAAVALESVEDRTAFVKALPKLSSQSQKSGPPKPPTSGSVTESANDGDKVKPPAKPFENPSDVRAFIRNGR
jgi:hypothetical protein